jgi:DNA replication protein DnaC
MELKGIVVKQFFANDDFKIVGITPLSTPKELADAGIEPDKGSKTVKAKGNNMSDVRIGDYYSFELTPDPHPKYGMSYRIDSFKVTYPKDAKKQITLLNKIGKYFDKNAVSNNNYDLIKQVKASETPVSDLQELIRTKKPTTLKKGFVRNIENMSKDSIYDEYFEQFPTLTEGVTRELVRIAEQSKKKPTFEQMQTNPFKALWDASNNAVLVYHDMLLSENIATLARTSPWRVHHAAKQSLSQSLGNTGNTVVPLEDGLSDISHRLNEPSLHTILSALGQKVEYSRVKIIGDFLTTKHFYDYETTISEFAKQAANQALTKRKANDKTIDVLKAIDKLPDFIDSYVEENKNYLPKNFSLTREQLRFVHSALQRKMTVLTGNAGTGKSFTIGFIIAYLKELGFTIHATAPTAKAAKVLGKYAKVPGRTVHSIVLGMGEPADILIVDEASMIDDSLMNSIIEYLNENTETTLILSGDVAQIPPVSNGAPFRDLIERYPNIVTRLTTVQRQKDLEQIEILTKARLGRLNLSDAFQEPIKWSKSYGNFQYKKMTSLDEIKDGVTRLVSKGVNPEEIGVIASLNQTVYQLNDLLRETLNPNQPFVSMRVRGEQRTFALNDPVLLTSNQEYIDFETLFDEQEPKFISEFDGFERLEPTKESERLRGINGDFGKIVRILNDTQFVVEINATSVGKENYQLLFDVSTQSDKDVTALNVVPAYAFTVHKAQGSQFKYVIFVADSSYMTSVNLLYTALSRTTDKIIVFVLQLPSNRFESRQTLLSNKVV